MTNIVESKIELLEKLLREMTDAAYGVIVESNGVSDNEWRVKDGIATPEFPVRSFYKALKELEKAWNTADCYFKPIESERAEKWADACATASFIMDIYKEERVKSRRADSSLHRNIADAIYGVLKQTSEQRREGTVPKTMQDRLNDLVSEGKLVELKPSDL